MTWARLDDGFYAHPKIRRALGQDPGAVALFALALSWSAGHEQDGHIPPEAMEMLFPVQKKRARALKVLDDVGLVQRNGDGAYVVHDYLDYNLSRDEIATRRRADRARKSSGRKVGA